MTTPGPTEPSRLRSLRADHAQLVLVLQNYKQELIAHTRDRADAEGMICIYYKDLELAGWDFYGHGPQTVLVTTLLFEGERLKGLRRKIDTMNEYVGRESKEVAWKLVKLEERIEGMVARMWQRWEDKKQRKTAGKVKYDSGGKDETETEKELVAQEEE